MSPPGGDAAPTTEAAAHQQPVATTTDKTDHIASVRPCSGGTAPWNRRRRAAWRCVPLKSGHRDPWQPWRPEPPLSTVMVDAGRDAALHVLADGRTPLLEVEVLRALYRRGGDDRALAQELFELAGGEIA